MDYGDGTRKRELATHALVFILCGMRRPAVGHKRLLTSKLLPHTAHMEGVRKYIKNLTKIRHHLIGCSARKW